MNILLADDEEMIARVARMALEKIGGHKVTWVTNGQLVIDTLQEGVKFDVILLDGMMPVRDGINTCIHLRNKLNDQTPIIFLSAKSHDTEIQTALAAGATGYIQKPFDPKTLSTEISKILDNPSDQRSSA
jgi:CheY-like chemotaxis protein